MFATRSVKMFYVQRLSPSGYWRNVSRHTTRQEAEQAMADYPGAEERTLRVLETE